MAGRTRRCLLWAGTSACAVLASGALAGTGGAAGMRLVGAESASNPGGQATIVVDDDRQQCPEAQYTDLRLAALAALPGDTILVCPGTYPGPVVVTRPLTFTASNPGDTRHEGALDSSRQAIVLAGPVGDGFTLAVDSAGTTIDGFVITGGAQPVFDAGINIIDPAGTGYQIVNNLITNNNVGMYFHSIGGAPSRIEHNAFVTNNAGGFPSPNTGTAIFTQGYQINDTSIDHNYFEGHTDSAVNLGDGSQHGLVIDHNTSVNDSTFLVLGRANGSVVSDNGIEGVLQSALYFFGDNNGVKVVGNHIAAGSSDPYSGIRLTGPYFGAVGPNLKMTIADNDVRNFGYGIRGSNVMSSTFDHNNVRDNSTDGIQLGDTTYAPATGNTLTDNHASNDATFDCEDQSHGTGTAGTANNWVDDHGKTSSPSGICR